MWAPRQPDKIMLNQAIIATLSLLATYLSLHHKEALQRFACFAGLIVQPFWMVTTYANRQWGMFALCFVYGTLWALNFKRHWMK